MARTKGQLNFSANIEVKKQAALDARTVVATVADLTTAATWQDSDGAVWLYDGLVVAVSSTGELWMLTDADNYTQTASWKRIDGGGVEAGVYMVGDISTLTTSSQPTDIKGILGTPAALKAAVKAGEVIVVRSNGTDDTQNALYAVQVSYSSGNTVAINGTFGVGYLYIELTGTGDAWTSVDAAETKELAFKPDVVQSVTATANKGIEIGGTTTKPTVGLKIDSTGNVKLSTGANGLKASYEDFATGIDATDQVLTANATKLKANLGLQYDSEAKQIKLTGKSNAVIATIDATDFIKDGMVQSVELEGNNLVITFNTDAGAEPISVDLSKFLDVYTAGNGITISGKSIAVKPYMGLVVNSNGVAVNINSGDKYLGFSAGALVSKGIDAAIEAAITEAFSWHEVGE